MLGIVVPPSAFWIWLPFVGSSILGTLDGNRSLPDHDLAPLRKDGPEKRGPMGAIEMGVE
jgi:hypothetical protein